MTDATWTQLVEDYRDDRSPPPDRRSWLAPITAAVGFGLETVALLFART